MRILDVVLIQAIRVSGVPSYLRCPATVELHFSWVCFPLFVMLEWS